MQMAAVLKKRVVAELTQTTQFLNSPPAKKFKISDESTAKANLPTDLNSCKTHKDVLRVLASLAELFPMEMDRVSPLADHLVGYFQVEKQSIIKVKILEIIHRLVQYPCFDSKAFYLILKELMKNQDSCDVIGGMLSILKTIGLLNVNDHRLLTDIVQYTLEIIKNSSHIVRSKCIDLIGHIASNDIAIPVLHKYQPKNRTILNDILIVHTDDPDWRVRLSALEAILQWHQRRLPLGSSLYEHLVLLLEDNEEKIRLTVVKLLWVVAQMNPAIMVKTCEGGNVKMVDDCFAKLCETMTDISIDVRAQAAKLLGSMNDVSPNILIQTLFKSLMSDCRKKLSSHERQREMFVSGEWMAGKVANDAPREKIDIEDIVIFPKGAYGAFVNGLEDEFSIMRNASLDSLCELSCQHPFFANASQDFAVDMLTDEIDLVRLNGITSLHKMSKLLAVREDQLELILGVLKDFYAYMREATHKLLSSCSLSTTTGIKMTITSLLQNLAQYPEDRLSIWRTMKHLGDKNSNLVFAVLPSLLGLHPFFVKQEMPLDNIPYVALMILASNASPNCPTMTSILPPHIFNHFIQLKSVYPDLIPDAKLSHNNSLTTCSVQTSSLSNQKKFLSVILTQLNKINFMRDINSAYKLIKIACRDLNKVDDLAPDMSASAKFVTLHLKCQMKINEIMSQTKFSTVSQCPESVGQQIQKLARTLTYMKTSFVGITTTQLAGIQQLSLVVSAFQLLFDFPFSSPLSRKSSCFVFSDQVMKLTDLLVRSNMPSTRMLSHLNTELNHPQNSDVANYHRLLLSALRVHASTVPLLPQLDNHLLMMKTTIIEPINKSSSIYTVMPNYILPIRMIVKLENIEHVEKIRIHVEYANQQRYLMKPNIADFKSINRTKHKLVTMVMISSGVWSHPCQVKISVVYLPQCLLDDMPKRVTTCLPEESKFVSSLRQEFIELSEVITTTIHPCVKKGSAEMNDNLLYSYDMF